MGLAVSAVTRAHPRSLIASARGPNSRLADATMQALQAANVEIVQRPLREPDGRVAAEVADSDVLITGGAVIDTDVVRQLGRVRFILRPYVGYDDIDVEAAS